MRLIGSVDSADSIANRAAPVTGIWGRRTGPIRRPTISVAVFTPGRKPTSSSFSHMKALTGHISFHRSRASSYLPASSSSTSCTHSCGMMLAHPQIMPAAPAISANGANGSTPQSTRALVPSLIATSFWIRLRSPWLSFM